MNQRPLRGLALVFLLSLHLGCNSQQFQGPASAREEAPAEQETAVANENATPIEAPVVVSSEVTETPIEVTMQTEVLVVACKEKLAYDPSQILCSLTENDATKPTIWDRTVLWVDRVKSLKNPAAAWISPLAPVQSPATGSSCPFVPDSDKLIFVSNFTLTEDTTITLEAVIDDIGTVRLWKNADSKQEIYTSTKAAKIDATIPLTKGFYSFVADGVDVGRGATGMIMSIFNAKGEVIRKTEASTTDWCIFRVKAETDVPTFVNSASSCRTCLAGNKAAKAP